MLLYFYNCSEPAEAEKALGLIKNILAMQNGVNKAASQSMFAIFRNKYAKIRE